MTRRDFVLIAHTINSLPDTRFGVMVGEVAEAFADALEQSISERSARA